MYIVYLICAEIEGKKLYKIGYTKRSAEVRLKEFRTGNASDMYIVDTFKSQWGTKVESSLHRRYRDKKVQGEWFDLCDDEVKGFNESCKQIHNMFNIISETTYYQQFGRFH